MERNRAKQAIQLGLFLVLIILTASAIGCGGGTQTANGSPTPVPSPTPVNGSPSLSATPSSLAFGTQVLNTAMTQTVKITTVGVTTPINLNAGQSLNVPVVFNPGAAGTVNGTLALVSNGTTLLSVPLSGTGLAPLAHSVDVTWAASTSTPLQGYNVYRSTVSGGPYTKLSPTLSPTTLLYTDTTPLSGKQYFYVVTALNTSGAESAASPEVAVTIPVP
jgi:hypothetical protein